MRLIDADALMVQLANKHAHSWGKVERAFGEVAEMLNNAPTIDAEPVVRCRECVHCLWDELNKDKKGRCMEHHLWCEADGFCHKGAKMDGGAE